MKDTVPIYNLIQEQGKLKKW